MVIGNRGGGLTYNPGTGAIRQSGFALRIQPLVALRLEGPPTLAEFEHYLLRNQALFEADPDTSIQVLCDQDGVHYIHLVRIEADFFRALSKARAFNISVVSNIDTGEIYSSNEPADTEFRITRLPRHQEGQAHSGVVLDSTAPQVVTEPARSLNIVASVSIATWAPEVVNAAPHRNNVPSRFGGRQAAMAAAMSISFLVSFLAMQRQKNDAPPRASIEVATESPPTSTSTTNSVRDLPQLLVVSPPPTAPSPPVATMTRSEPAPVVPEMSESERPIPPSVDGQVANVIANLVPGVFGEMRGFRVSLQADRHSVLALGLHPGDLVTAVNGSELNDPAQLDSVRSGQAQVTVIRAGLPHNITVNLEGAESPQLELP